MYSGSLFNTLSIHWDRAKMLKKSPYDKIWRKCTLFFLLRSPTHHTFTFNSRFFYENTRFVSLYVCEVFSLSDSFWFFLKFIFLLYKKHENFDFKTSQFFSKLKEKSHIHFYSNTSGFSFATRRFKNQLYLRERSSPKTDLVTIFLKFRKSKLWESSFFSLATLSKYLIFLYLLNHLFL